MHECGNFHRQAIMLVRSLSIVAVTFVLQGMPALCLAGLLEHPCTCSHPQEDCHCEHEQDCSSDPCAKLLTSQNRSRADDLPESPSLAVPLPDLILPDAAGSGLSTSVEPLEPFHVVRHYDVMLPLLI